MAALQGQPRYQRGEQIGEGTFGVVFQATDKLTNEVVAVKKIRLGKAKEGVNVTALREIKLLQELRHENVITLLDIFPYKRNLHLVFEYMETDLEAVIKDKRLHLGIGDIKSYLQMTLRAMEYCHANWVVHRDLKPNNLLISPSGVLKLADFGLAKVFGSPAARLTNQVFARWYRSPELLFGSRAYGAGVDIWAVGCIFGELLKREPLFPGNSDIDQLGKIFHVLGTPTDAQWPGMRSLPDFVEYVQTPAQPLRVIFPTATEDAISLVQGMVLYDPNRRLTATGGLAHPFFRTLPAATAPAMLPRPRKQGPGRPGGDGGADGGDAAGPRGGAADGGGGGGAPHGHKRHFGEGGDGAGGDGERGGGSPGGGAAARAVALALRKSFPPQPQVGIVQHHPMATVARVPLGGVGRDSTTPGRDGGAAPSTMGTECERLERPQLTSTDKQYLRKRKLDLDQALEQASSSPHEEAMLGVTP